MTCKRMHTLNKRMPAYWAFGKRQTPTYVLRLNRKRYGCFAGLDRARQRVKGSCKAEIVREYLHLPHIFCMLGTEYAGLRRLKLARKPRIDCQCVCVSNNRHHLLSLHQPSHGTVPDINPYICFIPIKLMLP